jgi:hypothetical protein
MYDDSRCRAVRQRGRLFPRNGVGVTLRVGGRQPFPYRIMEGLPVTGPESHSRCVGASSSFDAAPLNVTTLFSHRLSVSAV